MQIELIVRLEEFATCMAYKWLGYPSPGISFVAAVGSRTNAGSRHITNNSCRSSIKFISYSRVLGRRYSFYNKIGYQVRVAMLYMFLWNEKIYLELIFIPMYIPIQVGLFNPNILSVAEQEQKMKMAGLFQIDTIS